VDVAKAHKKQGLAHQVVALIAKLYHIERELKDKHATPALIFMTRVQKSKSIVLQIKALLDEAQLKVPPKSPLGTALFYSLTHWESLNIFLFDGRLELDNNLSERTIKPFVIGRKNWLFNGNELGAKAASILFSLIETCKQNKIETFSWFKYVLTHIRQANTLKQLELLLPYNIDPSLLIGMRSLPNPILPEKSVVN
jgi:transposase